MFLRLFGKIVSFNTFHENEVFFIVLALQIHVYVTISPFSPFQILSHYCILTIG